MTIGDRIQFYRKQKEMSQEDLAERLLVSRQTVSQWEKGQTVPTVDNLLRLRDIFGVSLDNLVDDISQEEEAPREVNAIKLRKEPSSEMDLALFLQKKLKNF